MYDTKTQENFNAIPPPLYSDFEGRVKVLGKHGIDMAILSFPAPGPDSFGSSAAVELCRIINDEISHYSETYPDVFSGIASIPFSNVPLALDEMDRAVTGNGLRGIMAYTNIRGKFLDSEEFFPIFRKAQSLGVPVYIHPTIPSIASAIGQDFGMNLLLGWPFETGMSILRLALTGTLELFKGTKFIVSHAGGIIPFCASRIDTLYSAHAREMSHSNSKVSSPLKSLKMHTYADLALYGSPSATKCALDFFHPGRCMFATDYAYGPRLGTVFLRSAIRTIHQLQIPEEDKHRLLGQNALSLFKIG